jgi:hypothetical protein
MIRIKLFPARTDGFKKIVHKSLISYTLHGLLLYKYTEIVNNISYRI